MPSKNHPPKVVSLDSETSFIVECYVTSLVESGLISPNRNKDVPDEFRIESNLHLDARLLIQPLRQRTGFLPMLARGLEKVSQSAHGGFARSLQEIEFHIGDMELYELYEDYIKTWSTLLKEIKRSNLISPLLNDKHLDEATIENPYVLTMQLLLRLVLFILSEENIQKLDHARYFTLIDLFVRKCTGNGSPFKKDERYDALGQYLLTRHTQTMLCFQHSMECQSELVAHKSTIYKMEELLVGIKKTTQRQLLAYWNQDADSAALADVNYLGNLESWEQKTLAHHGDTSLALPSHPSKEERYEALIEFASDKKHKHHLIIGRLYQLLVHLEHLALVVNSVRSLINDTGWISLLFNVLRLNPLGDYFKEFYDAAAHVLNIEEQTPTLPTQSKAYNALLHHRAHNIAPFAQLPHKIEQATRKLDDPALHQKIINKIISQLVQLVNVQKRLGITLVDPKMLAHLPPLTQHTAIEMETNSEKSPQKHPLKALLAPQEQQQNEDLKQPTLKKPPLEELRLFFNEAHNLTLNKEWEKLVARIKTIIEGSSLSVIDALPEIKDSLGNNLLHVMATYQRHEQCNWLLKNQFPILSPNDKGVTPLENAAQHLLESKKAQKLYFKLCTRAHEDAQHHLTGLLTERQRFIKTLYNNLKRYQKIQYNRFSNPFWPMKLNMMQFFGVDYTVERAIEAAQSLLLLNTALVKKNQYTVIPKLRALFSPLKKHSAGSVLHTLMRRSLADMESVLNSAHVSKFSFLSKKTGNNIPLDELSLYQDNATDEVPASIAATKV